MAETAGHQFFQRMLPECNEPPQATCRVFSDGSVWGKLGAALLATNGIMRRSSHERAQFILICAGFNEQASAEGQQT